MGFIWQSVRFNILNPPGYERGLSKNSQNALETSLNHSTKALRSHVASDRGVFSCAGRDNGCLIPLLANNLRLLDNLWASLLLPAARHRCPHVLGTCSPVFGRALCGLWLAAPEVMVWLVEDVSVWCFESDSAGDTQFSQSIPRTCGEARRVARLGLKNVLKI